MNFPCCFNHTVLLPHAHHSLPPLKPDLVPSTGYYPTAMMYQTHQTERRVITTELHHSGLINSNKTQDHSYS